MMSWGRMGAAGIFASLVLSGIATADIKVKLETHYSVVGGPPGVADASSIVVFFVRGPAHRKDVWSELGSHSAIIRQCESGQGYFVDYDHKQYWEIPRQLSHPTPPKPGGVPKAIVRSRTLETGKPRLFFGRLAHHFVTTVEEFLGSSAGPLYVEETIEGWYWSDGQEVSGECKNTAVASQPYSWIGVPKLIDGVVPEFQHTGPSPTGMAVEETRTVRTENTRGQDGGKAVTTLEQKVVEFSDSTLDPSLFLVPGGFRKIPSPVQSKAK